MGPCAPHPSPADGVRFFDFGTSGQRSPFSLKMFLRNPYCLDRSNAARWVAAREPGYPGFGCVGKFHNAGWCW